MLNIACDCCNNKVQSLIDVYDIKEDDYLLICEDCINENDNIFWCAYHGRYEKVNNTNAIYEISNDYGTICKDAYLTDDDFYCCDCCGNYFHTDDMFEFGYEILCSECYEAQNVISEYHSHDYDEFLEDDFEDTDQFYGIELEVEVFNKPIEVAKEIETIIDGELFMEYDGSLANGLEIISKPFSYNYMVNHLSTTLKDLCNTLEGEINTERPCGMHIHITKQSYEHMMNLVYLVEYYQTELTILSNRKGKDLKRWASFLIDIENHSLLSKNIINAEFDNTYRYFAVNCSNSDTVEVRIFATTNDVKEILGRVELIHNLSEYAKENEIDFNNMPSFINIATYKEDRYVSYILGKYNLLKPLAI